MSENNTAFFNPSYINHFSNWVEGLPGTSWAYYSGLGVILFTLQTASAWRDGAIPAGTLMPIHIFLAAAISFFIAVIPYFDQRARSALETIKPALNIDEEKYQELEYQLTNLPALRSILASILTLVFVYTIEFMEGGSVLF